jgi:putative acetyltransferase
MTRPVEIRAAELSAPEVVRLLQEHLEFVAIHSPPESVHALDLDALRAPEISFWTAWEGSVLVGCGALEELSTTHGELKSLRTASSHLRRGVAAGLVEHLLGLARERGYRRVSLETGSMEAFAPVHALYASFGFQPCEPFANYIDNPYSTFMTRELGA